VVVGFMRLMESTHRNKNGHHPHEHIIVFMRVPEDFDAAGFFKCVQKACKEVARKACRSCTYTGKWWFRNSA
jgi:hypothetical protein